MQSDGSIAPKEFVLIISLFVQRAEKCLAPAKKSQPHLLWLCREKWECLITVSDSSLLQVFHSVVSRSPNQTEVASGSPPSPLLGKEELLFSEEADVYRALLCSSTRLHQREVTKQHLVFS